MGGVQPGQCTSPNECRCCNVESIGKDDPQVVTQMGATPSEHAATLRPDEVVFSAGPGMDVRSLNTQLRVECPEGLRFVIGSLDLTTDDDKLKLPAVATLLRKHSDCAVLITSFAEKARGVPEKVGEGVAWNLSLRRAVLCRSLLQDQGCSNFFACVAKGHIDDGPPRCELLAVSESQALDAAKASDMWEQDPVAAAQKEINEAMLIGIAFEPGYARLQPESEATILKLVEAIVKHPGLGFRILGYTGRPGHRLTPDQPACVNLSAKRCEVVRDRLREFGVGQPLVVKGFGHVDSAGARTVVEAAELHELQEDKRAPRPEPQTHYHKGSMEVCFEGKKVTEAGQEDAVLYVTFTRKPLGLSLRAISPLTVAKVERRHHLPAEQAGVKEGMMIRMINGINVANMDYDAAYKVFCKHVEGLNQS